MAYRIPPNGTYRRKIDGARVEVVGCTGNTTFTDTVAVQGDRLSHVRLENFWTKYEAHDPMADNMLLANESVAWLERRQAES